MLAWNKIRNVKENSFFFYLKFTIKKKRRQEQSLAESWVLLLVTMLQVAQKKKQCDICFLDLSKKLQIAHSFDLPFEPKSTAYPMWSKLFVVVVVVFLNE